jgi:hypothetical protein
MVEVDKCVRRPQPVPDLFARDDFTGTFQQHYQKVERLRLQADFVAFATQFAGVKVRCKRTEEDDPGAKHGRSVTANWLCDAWAEGIKPARRRQRSLVQRLNRVDGSGYVLNEN